jgi:hypothetical protein
MVSNAKHGLNALHQFRSPDVVIGANHHAASKNREIATDADQDHLVQKFD